MAAPSVYGHYANLQALTGTVLEGFFAALSADIAAARDRHAEGVDGLLASCSAYLLYAERFPGRYAMMFRDSSSTVAPTGVDESTAIFQLLLDAVGDCVAAGRSADADVALAATAVWAALDGYANLRAHRPCPPWPAPATLVSHLVLQLARIPPETASDPCQPV